VDRIHRLAHALTNAGVKPGDTVAVLDWDTPRYLECFFAVPMIGAVLHTVNVRLSPDQVLYTMNHAEDDLVLIHDDFLPLMEQINDQLETVTGFIQLTDDKRPKSTSLKSHGEYEELLKKADNCFDFPDFDENSIATTFYTTGTTGNPKGVFFSHRQLVLHTLSMTGTLSHFDEVPLIRSNSVYMPFTPMFHVHAWGVPYAATMMGVKQVYPGRYEPEALVDLLKTHKVTFSHCVPTIMQMLMATEGIKTADLSNWHVLIGGSAPPKGLCDAAAKLGMHMYTGYGMSETGPLLTATHLKPGTWNCPQNSRPPSASRLALPFPWWMCRSWMRTATNSPGRRSPGRSGHPRTLADVRLPENPEKSEELWAGGWLHTGDVASIEPDNTLVIKDRIKDVIKTGGEWISSLDLENMISQHPAVAGAAVVGIPDDKWGNAPMRWWYSIPARLSVPRTSTSTCSSSSNPARSRSGRSRKVSTSWMTFPRPAWARSTRS